MYGYVRICTDMYGYVRICTDMYRYVRICTDMYGDVWRCTDMYGEFAISRHKYYTPSSTNYGIGEKGVSAK